MKLETPIIKELTEREVACVSFKGNYIGNAEVFANLFNTLCGWAGAKGLLTPQTQYLSAYQDDPNVTPPDELSLDVCMSIPESTETEGEVEKKVLPGGIYAVMHAELANPEEFDTSWKHVVKWGEEKGYEMDMTRPSYEIYLNNPEEHPEKLNIIDICLSVKEKN